MAAVTSAGRRSRTVPPALRRALLARDRGCRFPGCGNRFAEAHHIVHWADGGRTAAVVFFTAEGRAVAGAPESPTPFPGAALYARDRNIPWSIEARAWGALDTG